MKTFDILKLKIQFKENKINLIKEIINTRNTPEINNEYDILIPKLEEDAKKMLNKEINSTTKFIKEFSIADAPKKCLPYIQAAIKKTETKFLKIIDELKAEHKQEITELKAEHNREIAELKAEHNREIAEHKRVIEMLTQKIDFMQAVIERNNLI